MKVNKRKARPAKDASAGERARAVAALWDEKPRATRGPRPGLGVEAIARVAIEIADAEGLDAVSMQRVASELGYTTMALYRHVPGKIELIDQMIEAAVGGPPELAGLAWREGLERWAEALWDAFHGHAWLLGACSRLRIMGPKELAWMDRALAMFAGTGLSPTERHRAFLVLVGHVHSATRFALPQGAGRSVSGEQWAEATRSLLQEHGERFPALQAMMAAGGLQPAEDDGLGFGLRCVLDGIGVLIAQRAMTR